MFYPIKIPWWVQKIYPHYIWRFSENEKIIYLTFDDGPTPDITSFVLSELKKHNATATFFCIGQNVETHPELFQSLIKQNHSVGNHTYSHPNGWKTSNENYFSDIKKCQALVNSRLFRPPYGLIKNSQYASIRYQYSVIMWHVLSGDFDTKNSPEKCLRNVLQNAGNGSIVVFHDSVKASESLLYALPRALEYFSEKGFSFRAIPC